MSSVMTKEQAGREFTAQCDAAWRKHEARVRDAIEGSAQQYLADVEAAAALYETRRAGPRDPARPARRDRAMPLPVHLAELAADRCRDGEATLVLITRSEGASLLTGTAALVRHAGEGAARASDPDLLAAVMVAGDGTETAYAEPAQTPGWLTWGQLTDAEQRLIVMGALGPPERMPSGRPVSRDNWLVLGGAVRTAPGRP